jgi:hypothetical protein
VNTTVYALLSYFPYYKEKQAYDITTPARAPVCVWGGGMNVHVYRGGGTSELLDAEVFHIYRKRFQNTVVACYVKKQ